MHANKARSPVYSAASELLWQGCGSVFTFHVLDEAVELLRSLTRIHVSLKQRLTSCTTRRDEVNVTIHAAL